jgi:2-polyprenyl-3-methyl-5-hydroxy-6-metoxy-1,4-benzoquinol methylase
MTPPPTRPSGRHRTLQSYESFAREYANLVSPQPPTDVEAALRRLMAAVRPGARVLEVGSGPGRDADFIETLGASVRRTDATQAFLDLQAARDKQGELLDLVADALGGPYDAVLAMCVLIHVERAQTDAVLRKIASALRPGGAFLVSVREGDGETGGDYHMTYWRRGAFAAALAAAGLHVAWDHRYVDSASETWLMFLTRTHGPQP